MYLALEDNDMPTNQTFWKRSTWCGRFPDILTITPDKEHEALVGVYYLGVLGSSSSVYSVVYTAEREDEENGEKVTYQTPVVLSQDKTSRGVLRNSKQYQIYKFTVHDLPSSDDIVIALSP